MTGSRSSMGSRSSFLGCWGRLHMASVLPILCRCLIHECLRKLAPAWDLCVEKEQTGSEGQSKDLSLVKFTRVNFQISIQISIYNTFWGLLFFSVFAIGGPVRWSGMGYMSSPVTNSERAEAYLYFFTSSTTPNIVPSCALHIPGSQ